MADLRRINFTKKTLEAVAIPEPGKRTYVYDTNKKANGLAMSVTPNGVRTFFVRKRIKGRSVRYKIGHFPETKIFLARKKAGAVCTEIDGGGDPYARTQASRTELTFKEMFSEYMERHAKVYKKTWEGDQGHYDRCLSKWGPRKLSSISKRLVQDLHNRTEKKRGPYTANRVQALVHTVFAKAIEWGYFEEPNPAHGIKKFKEKSRDRFLQTDELPRFFKALGKEENTIFTDFFLLSLLTGARRGNVLAMRWEEINWEQSTWTIPETKNGDAHCCPLVPDAIRVLKEREATSDDDCEWVFPGTGKTGHLVEVKGAWRRILKRAKIKDLRMHDLRRTLGSWQAAQGTSLAIIGKSLAHKNVSTTLIYSRLNIDPVRDSMERATAAIMEASNDD